MRQKFNRAMRWGLLRAKIHPVPEGYRLDPHSAEYLYLVQQCKRLSLASSIGRVRFRNALTLPLIALIVLLKLLDLWIANQIIRAMINEHDLLQLSLKDRGNFR